MVCKTGVKHACSLDAKKLTASTLRGYSSMVEQQPSKLRISRGRIKHLTVKHVAGKPFGFRAEPLSCKRLLELNPTVLPFAQTSTAGQSAALLEPGP